MLACSKCGRESPEGFAFCPACGAPLLPTAPAREVRKTVTVLFCDMAGSTALGERLDPEPLRDVQSRYFDAMRRAIERHGGTVEKYIGDAVMAVFGIPQLHEDDALRAVRAASDMREALAALNQELERDRGVAIKVRIGVNTGEVVAGDPARGQSLVTGDAVNVAARLEQHAPPGEVLLGDATHRLVRDVVETLPVEPLDAKGKSEGVPAWRLLGVREAPPALRRMASPMVGRERHLMQLRRAFEATVDDGACQLFTVLSAAGVGKSRLAEEFLAGLGDDNTILQGRCLPYGEGITYFPVVEAIKQAAGLADFDLPDVVEAKVCSVLEGDEHQELVCRHVSQLMGVADAPGGEETFWAIRRFFEAAASERPLVLVFDDVHWGEPTFLDLVEHIADWSRGSPILLLCMARPDLLDARPGWGGGKMNAATVSLQPLTDAQSDALISNLLGTAHLSVEVSRRIVGTTEGNPLFVEETLRMLMDDGLVIREGERWIAAGPLSDLTVPASVHALLAARLDRLTRKQRTVLEAAAVIGQEFPAGAIRDLVTGDAGVDVTTDLMSLVRKDLIRPVPARLTGEDTFRFRHLLIRDTAYEAIPKAARAEMHERVAEWLERVAGEAVLEQEEIVGYHFEQAHAYRQQLGPSDDRSRAIGVRAAARLASAGRRASARGDVAAGASLLRRALASGGAGGPVRAAVLYDLGTALIEVSDVHEAIRTLDQAVELAAAAGDVSLEWLARIERSEAQMEADPHSRSTEAIRKELEEAVGVFEAVGNEAGLSAVWTKLVMTEWMPCRFDRGAIAAHRAVAHARRCGDERLLAEALLLMLISQSFGSVTPEEGHRLLDELSEDIARTRRLEASALVLRGLYHGLQGDFEEARRLVALGIEISETLGLRFMLAIHEQFLGDVEGAAGDRVAAERAYRSAYEILDQKGSEGTKSTTAASLARALCALARFDEAERYAAIARSVADDDDLSSQVFGRSAHATLLAQRGELVEAESLAHEAIEMFAEAEYPNGQAELRMDLAQILRTRGKPEEAEAAALEALGFFEGKGNRPSSASTRAFIEELRGTR